MALHNRILETRSWNTDIALLILRIGSGGSMLIGHGWGKFQRLTSGEEISFADPLGVGPVLSFILVVLAEFLCSILLMLGLFHRLAAFMLAFTMAVVVLIVKLGEPFGEWEKAFIFLIIFISLLLTGPGKLSLDHYLFNRKK